MHNEMEKRVLDDMRQFAFKPDGWEISFVQGYDIREASERQRWWLFNLYIIMKQQATDMEALKHCFEFYLEHPSPPPKYHQQVSVRVPVQNSKKEPSGKKKGKQAKKEPDYMDIGDFQEQHNMWADTFKEEVISRNIPTIGYDRYQVQGLKEVAALFINGELPYFKNKTS